jgi:anti-sigma factor RsiW
MSEVFRCDDKETFVAYLYGEVDPDVRREVERHLRGCAACQREAEGLQAVRMDLQAWIPPEGDLGFSIVRTPQPVPVLTSSRWALPREMPAWARVAAAALFIGLGLGLANLQVRTTGDGFAITTGWRQPASDVATTTDASATSPPMAAVVPVAAGGADAEWRRELNALEQTLRQEIAASRVSRAAAPGAETAVDSAAILRRVESMIEASAERQRQAFSMSLIQADRQWRSQRYADLQNITRSVNGLQSRTFAVQANQQELLRRASLTQPNQ